MDSPPQVPAPDPLVPSGHRPPAFQVGFLLPVPAQSCSAPRLTFLKHNSNWLKKNTHNPYRTRNTKVFLFLSVALWPGCRGAVQSPHMPEVPATPPACPPLCLCSHCPLSLRAFRSLNYQKGPVSPCGGQLPHSPPSPDRPEATRPGGWHEFRPAGILCLSFPTNNPPTVAVRLK